MLTDYQEILEAATALPEARRLRLVDALLESAPPFDSPKIESAWLDEIEHRCREADAGNATFSTWAEVKARARRRRGCDE